MTKQLTAIGFFALALGTSAAQAQSGDHLETIHHPNYDKSVFMPFPPALKVKSGKLLWLAGGTALPVYHDHPHKREQVIQYLTNDLEAQTKRAMDGVMETPPRLSFGKVHSYMSAASGTVEDAGTTFAPTPFRSSWG